MSGKHRKPARGTDDYRVTVEDFGPIVNASIAVRPLTVFIGPSNTGKSYLAILLYALHRFLGRPRDFRRDWRFRGWFTEQPKRLTGAALESLKTWVSATSREQPAAPPTDLVSFVRTELERAAGPNGVLEKELRRCYGVDRLGDLARRQKATSGAAIEWRVPQPAGAPDTEYRFTLGQHAARGTFSGVGMPSIEAELTESFRDACENFTNLDRADVASELAFTFPLLLDRIFLTLFKPVRRAAYYLPADRTGVMHSHQVVVSTLVQNAATAGLRPSRDVPMLSGVLADFLSTLIEMGAARRSRHRQGIDLGTRLEQAMLDGSVQLERTDAGYPTFAYRPRGWKGDLPLMRASSMVSELAPVVLYLRHVVRPGDVLIIEEPEAHLHPAMQAAFARELARLVRDGVRIVMTTHSEWFLEQIGNLVRFSELSERERKGLDGADCALRPDEVGAWLFKPSSRPAGSVVEEVTLDAETGLYPTDYHLVSEMLYNQGAATFNRVQARNEA